MLDKLLGGGSMTWIILAVLVFMVLRGGSGGSVIDQILEVLRKLFNRPDPNSHRFRMNNCHDCCNCVMELANHFDKKGLAEEATKLREMLPKLARGHGHGTE